MLTRHTLALVERDLDAANRSVDDYLANHPDDPFAVRLHCAHQWDQRDWPAARSCYRRLAELAPNQVEAQNRLGYIEMAEGRFEDAEAQFRIYAYLAPDQANPHDSMGELMMVTGRFDEAEDELRQAVAMKPDFCASWHNLALLELFRGDFTSADGVLDEARRGDGCTAEDLERWGCVVELWRQSAAGRWQTAWDAARACGGSPVEPPLAYLAAAAAGDVAAVEDQIEKLRTALAERGTPASSPYLEHLLMLRSLADGEPEAAAAHGRAADEAFQYWSGEWGLKLHNRHLTAQALEEAGHAEEAARLRQALREVNPSLGADFPIQLPDLAAAPRLPQSPPTPPEAPGPAGGGRR